MQYVNLEFAHQAREPGLVPENVLQRRAKPLGDGHQRDRIFGERKKRSVLLQHKKEKFVIP